MFDNEKLFTWVKYATMLQKISSNASDIMRFNYIEIYTSFIKDNRLVFQLPCNADIPKGMWDFIKSNLDRIEKDKLLNIINNTERIIQDFYDNNKNTYELIFNDKSYSLKNSYKLQTIIAFNARLNMLDFKDELVNKDLIMKYIEAQLFILSDDQRRPDHIIAIYNLLSAFLYVDVFSYVQGYISDSDFPMGVSLFEFFEKFKKGEGEDEKCQQEKELKEQNCTAEKKNKTSTDTVQKE